MVQHGDSEPAGTAQVAPFKVEYEKFLKHFGFVQG